MVEPRRELRLAHEALQDHIVTAQALVQHLDDRLPAEQRLLAAIDRAKPPFVDSFTKNEFADHPSAKILAIPHPVVPYHRSGRAITMKMKGSRKPLM